MDPRTIATVLSLLLLFFSGREDKAADAPRQPSVNVRGAALEGSAEGSAAPAADLDLGVGADATVRETSRVRAGPGTNYSMLSKVPAGVRLSVLSRRGDWYQVRLPGGEVGWIAGFLLAVPREPASPEGVREGGAEVRTGSGTRSRRIAGYYTEDYPGDPTSYGSLSRRAALLDDVAMFLHGVDENGRVSGAPSSRAIEAARAGGARTLALVHNLTPSGFDGKRAHALLQTSNSRARAISDILAILQHGKYQGVNIDLENVDPSDRRNLSAFMDELAAKLRPRGYVVTISVPAKTQDYAGSTWVGAFDYYALGRSCDLVMLMTYDEHAWTSGPGPVASYAWVERVTKYAITQMPRGKILLGIAAYGYDWNLATGRVAALSTTQAAKRASALGITPSWDASAKAPHFSYSERGAKHEVWFESAESVRLKLDLVEKYDLGGIAIWKLGYEDQAFWDVIRARLR